MRPKNDPSFTFPSTSLLTHHLSKIWGELFSQRVHRCKEVRLRFLIDWELTDSPLCIASILKYESLIVYYYNWHNSLTCILHASINKVLYFFCFVWITIMSDSLASANPPVIRPNSFSSKMSKILNSAAQNMSPRLVKKITSHSHHGHIDHSKSRSSIPLQIGLIRLRHIMTCHQMSLR